MRRRFALPGLLRPSAARLARTNLEYHGRKAQPAAAGERPSPEIAQGRLTHSNPIAASGGPGLALLPGGDQVDAANMDQILGFGLGAGRIEFGRIDADMFICADQAFCWLGSARSPARPASFRASLRGGSGHIEGGDDDGVAERAIALSLAGAGASTAWRLHALAAPVSVKAAAQEKGRATTLAGPVFMSPASGTWMKERVRRPAMAFSNDPGAKKCRRQIEIACAMNRFGLNPW